MKARFPSAQDRVQRIFKAWSGFYDHPLPQRLFYGRIHHHLLDMLKHESHKAVLDAGCGTGELVARLAEEWPTAEITGVDLSTEMLDVARSKEYESPRVQFIEANVYELPFENERFDLLTNTISSHFYTDFEQALSEFYRVLKPGGRLCMASMGNGLLRYVPGPWKDSIKLPDTEFRSPQLQQQALEAAGFRVDDVVSLPVGWLYFATRP